MKSKRTLILFCVLGFMAADASVYEYLHHRYLSAALAPIFFLVVMPWLGWKWMKPER